MGFPKRLFFLLAAKILTVAWVADAAPVSQLLSREEYRALLVETAQKVNLFRDAWAKEPGLKFTGGTVRDYILWVEKQFRPCADRPCAERVMAELNALRAVEARSFILEDSDVDVISKTIPVAAENYGVRKIDRVPESEFVAGTLEHQSAVDQGFVPAERMLLGRETLTTGPGFGDGLVDLHSGRIGVALPDETRFWKTAYASRFENHPVLLVERYLRVVSLYYRATDDSTPTIEKLLRHVDAETEKRLRGLVQKSMGDPKLRECLKRSRFVSWHDKTVLKAFRAYTNPTATHLLFTHFGLDQLLKTIEGAPKINQFLFAKPRGTEDLARFRGEWAKLGLDERDVFLDAGEHIPGLKLYHGTRGEQAFRDILLRGVLESKSGAAGNGLYAVTEKSLEVTRFYTGGDPDLLVVFDVAPGARIVDFRNPKIQQAIDRYRANGGKNMYDDLGIDGGFFTYDSTGEAIVVKNAAILSAPKGVHREVLTLPQILERIQALGRRAGTAEELRRLADSIALVARGFTVQEAAWVADAFVSNFGFDALEEILRRAYSLGRDRGVFGTELLTAVRRAHPDRAQESPLLRTFERHARMPYALQQYVAHFEFDLGRFEELTAVFGEDYGAMGAFMKHLSTRDSRFWPGNPEIKTYTEALLKFEHLKRKPEHFHRVYDLRAQERFLGLYVAVHAPVLSGGDSHSVTMNRAIGPATEYREKIRELLDVYARSLESNPAHASAKAEALRGAVTRKSGELMAALRNFSTMKIAGKHLRALMGSINSKSLTPNIPYAFLRWNMLGGIASLLTTWIPALCGQESWAVNLQITFYLANAIALTGALDVLQYYEETRFEIQRETAVRRAIKNDLPKLHQELEKSLAALPRFREECAALLWTTPE